MFSSNNPFKIFSLETKFDIDKEQVESKLVELLKQWHPDKAVETSQKLEFAQKATNITEAYNLLSNDYKRADFLYKQLAESNPNHIVNERAINQEILKVQFELRSKVANLKDSFDFEAFLALSDYIADFRKTSYKQVVDAFETQDLQQIYDSIVQLRFVEKLEEELEVISSMQTNF